MNLKDDALRPNVQIQEIHTQTKNLPNAIKHIQVSIENHLRNLSSTEILFSISATHCKDNLRQSEYNKKLT